MLRGSLSHTSQRHFLVSLILGLGIAHLLLGIGRLIHRRDHARADAVQMLWTRAVFWTLILNWWVFFQERSVADYAELFERNRGWFLCLFALTSIADIMITVLRVELLDPPIYLPFALHFSALGLTGVFVKSRRFHPILASYVLGAELTWSLVVRRFLET